MTRIFRIIQATVVALVVMGGFAHPKAVENGPAGFYLVAIDDCGNWAREPHLLRGVDSEVAATSAPGASREERTFSQGDEVVYRYVGLPGSERYKLRVVYLSDSAGRVARLTAGGVQLQARFEEPEHKAEKQDLGVPATAIQNGVLEIRFEKVGAKSVAVSLIELWSTSSRVSQNLLVSAKGDSHGGITGTVTDWLYQPVRKGSIQVHYSQASADLPGTTDAVGRFSIHAPVTWRSLPPELLRVRASHEDFSALTEIGSLEVYPPEIRLTPRPTMVAGLKTLKVDLAGTWNFTVQPPPTFWGEGVVAPAQVDHIQVPGEWGMQGFSVPRNGAAGYWRTVEIPEGWAGQRVKLECDAVFSLAEVWVNGKKVGQNEGGFTPFEFDVTGNVEPGKAATIALLVKEDTMAAGLSAMPKYAQHEIGGITRKIYLFAVPEVNVFRLQTETRFDSQYQDATLHLTLGVGNQGKSIANKAEVRLHLTDPNGNPVPLKPSSLPLPVLQAREDQVQAVEIPIVRPLHWENEHPRLYRLVAELVVRNATVEVVERRVGFRQVEIRMGKLFLNGRAIKLHGIERHESNPLSGRSLSSAWWSKEVHLLREANMNYLFTSHYPVPEEFLDACDELGLLVTEEIPNVWVGQAPWGDPEGNRDPRYYNIVVSIAATTLEKDRSHAAIIFWQACDECNWGRNSESIMGFFKAADPSRPTNYSYEVGTVDFLSSHYPSLDETLQLPREGNKPHIFDQFASVPNYDFRELITDPGVRDYYGKAIASMWEAMYANPTIAGGAIWAWKDDTFYVPPCVHDQSRFEGSFDPGLGLWRVGYGDWGLIDGWLRKKPEYWHVKKAYSPLRIQEGEPLSMPVDRVLHIPADNRYNFTNLNELRIECSAKGVKCAASANVPPRTSGSIEVSLPQSAGDLCDLTLKFFNTSGELVDAYKLAVGNRSVERKAEAPLSGVAPHLEPAPQSILVRASDFYWMVDPKTNMMVAGPLHSPASMVGGPYLAVTPLEIPPFDYPYIGADSFTVLQPIPMSWTSSKVQTETEGAEVLIRATGRYEQFNGGYTIRLDNSGGMVLDYRFEYDGSDMDVREIGILFDIAANRDVLSWKRRSQWSLYPAGHIGRPEGRAPAFRNPREWPPAVFGQAPPWPWELDSTDGGTNDFRSTKYNILWASLTDAGGHGVRVESDGRQNVRAWVDHSRIKLLISDFSNGGGQGVLRFKQYAHEQKTLRKGDVIMGSVRLNLGGEPQPD